MKEYPEIPVGTYSVTEYAELSGVTTQAIRLRIKDGTLPVGVTACKVGSYYAITVVVPKKKRAQK